jgi:ABC-type multidrug transport system fused ATPase/permease subunit
MQWHHRHNAVELVSKLNTGAGKIVQTTDTAGRELLPALIRTLLSLIPLLWFSVVTAPIVILGLMAYLWMTTRENLLRRGFRRLRHDQYAQDAGMFTECVHNVNALVQFGQTDRLLGRYQNLQRDIIEQGAAEMEIAHKYAGFRNLLIAVTRRVSQGFWLWQYQRGRLDAPMVMYLNFLTDELIGSFGTYAGVMERVYDGVEPAGTVVALLSDPTGTRVSGTDGTHDAPGEIGLELRDIHFSYGGGSEVLRGMNLTIEPGSILGIVGASGIGKTTLQHLLSRMLDTDKGEVIVGGRDVRRWEVRQLRSMFSTVSQNGGVLFSHQTVAEAIRFARPQATLEEVIDAARCACIHNEILRMPEGYDTILGPGGVHLSKGQQQRIGLAQALLGLKDRRILVLDEFTSALDSRTEQQIIDNLKPRLKGKTVIIIAHRLATLHKLADRVVVLEAGKIVEEGSHTELVSRDSRYAELVRLQSIA